MTTRPHIVQLELCLCLLLALLVLSSGIVSPASRIGEQDSAIGYVSTHSDGCCDGYTLLCRTTQPILVDMNGTIINQWPCMFSQPAKMLPGGSIIAGSEYQFYAIACGDFGSLNEYSWNGTIVWSYNGWEDGRARQHHDFEREGNPVGYYAPGQDFFSHGTTLILAHHAVINASISRRPFIDDVIYEIDWNGTPTGFEWHASEHFNQFGFNAETKHGIYVSPGILGDGDLLHMNSMSLVGPNKWYSADPVRYSCFNPKNLIISSRNTNFLAIISRETGDVVWRVGPDFSKDTEAGAKLGRLIGFHHVHMIPQGLPGEGNILVFDNGGLAGYGYFGMPRYCRFVSRVIEFDPTTFDIVWEFSHPALNWWIPRTSDYHRFYSFWMSSAQRLPNGNTLISEATNGRVLEVTNTSEIVWEYTTPTRFQQVYRAYRIPPEWIPGNPSGYDFWE